MYLQRLWAELEQKKAEHLAMRAEHETALQEARQQSSELQEALENSNEKLKTLRSQYDETHLEFEQQEAKLRDKVNFVSFIIDINIY